MYDELANLIFPNALEIDHYEKLYPKRDLSSEAVVTRFGPSPTGFVHMGSLYTAFLASSFAKQSNGVFYVRIEDTDQEREVEDGVKMIFSDLEDYEIEIDESINHGGNYGPYIQSERGEIYEAYAKYLIRKGLAYPCFMSSDELNETRKIQESTKERIGYYGRWATYRTLSPDLAIKYINEGKPYVIRLKSQGDFNKRHQYHDLIKGNVDVVENDLDIVLIKSDGLPTYHFAHVVDDHLMRTTHVIRGDEWLSSLPIHLEMFKLLNFDAPYYAHVAPLNKNDEGTVRKLSKRKDPEASVQYYHKEGVPVGAVKLYLSIIGNTNFEEWYLENSDKTYQDFTFSFDKMPIGGTLFDIEKLNSVNKIYFSKLKAQTIYDGALKYFKQYDLDFYEIFNTHQDLSIALLNIERNTERPRKDIANYADIKKEFWYMYNDLYNLDTNKYNDHDLNLSGISEYFATVYNDSDTKEEWFNKLKEHCSKYNYAVDRKQYKANPDNYLGQVGDFATNLRIIVTTKTITPDLYELMGILKKDELIRRLEQYKQEKNL